MAICIELTPEAIKVSFKDKAAQCIVFLLISFIGMSCHSKECLKVKVSNIKIHVEVSGMVKYLLLQVS